MGLLATVAWVLGGVLVLLGVYIVGSLLVLFFVDFPEHPQAGYLVDLVFILVYPVVVAAVVFVTARQRITGNRTL